MELFIKENQEKTKKSNLNKLEAKIKKKFLLRHLLEWEVFVSMLLVGMMIFFGVKSTVAIDAVKNMIPDNPLPPQIPHEEEDDEVQIEQWDTSNWLEYSNKTYGFKLKYPSDWDEPKLVTRKRGDKFAAKYAFRKKQVANDNPLSGFDLAVYEGKKFDDLSLTGEIVPKKENYQEIEACQGYKAHVREVGSSSVVDVHIKEGDQCFESAFFYNAAGDYYVYNIIPVASGENAGKVTEKQSERFLPEFDGSISSFELFKISAPKPKVSSARLNFNVQRPVSAKKIGERYYCAKKNDKPRESKKTNKVHLDLQCCLDPDEIPNPWCVY